ncbi:hypothetical protein A3D00_03505 [Candidatus Woesebacteria bacterium RIFCSPHIGHO2_02_FULL_38_9]|nr:MAG: hypothetical protein A3D00_03505 [Candidatus Woesebacteria bacterium RIFCSPHIGHO2_02_FULL_38_9]OGM58749.1 MAG: hypothetical protein A3A50_03100 [Candidatus Woesebacteria bacterium RIFCSPLOWO2_01_FULL_38_20]
MPRFKRDLHDWPSLNSWLNKIGISDREIRENFFYSALVNYFPGQKNGTHRVPTNLEIERERRRLVDTIKNFNPEIVVPIGKLSISYCLDEKVEKLRDYIGKNYNVNPYKALNEDLLVIPLPHPSGASTWRHKHENMILLKKALKFLKTNLSPNNP